MRNLYRVSKFFSVPPCKRHADDAVRVVHRTRRAHRDNRLKRFRARVVCYGWPQSGLLFLVGGRDDTVRREHSSITLEVFSSGDDGIGAVS